MAITLCFVFLCGMPCSRPSRVPSVGAIVAACFFLCEHIEELSRGPIQLLSYVLLTIPSTFQVRSRGFTVLGDPHMIPGADMFNHDPNKQSVQIGTDGDDHFVMKTVSAWQRRFLKHFETH